MHEKPEDHNTASPENKGRSDRRGDYEPPRAEVVDTGVSPAETSAGIPASRA